MKLDINAGSNGVEAFVGGYIMPDTVAECITKFGEEVVYNLLASRLLAVTSHKARTMKKNKKSNKEIQTVLDGWLPSAREAGEGVTALAKDIAKTLKGTDPAAKAREIRAMLVANGINPDDIANAI